MKKSDSKYTIGIDEAGRGPVAGPVSVGACCISEEWMPSALEIFGTVKDSKKLTAKKREEWYAKMQEEKKNGNIDFVVAFASSHDIDNWYRTLNPPRPIWRHKKTHQIRTICF